MQRINYVKFKIDRHYSKGVVLSTREKAKGDLLLSMLQEQEYRFSVLSCNP